MSCRNLCFHKNAKIIYFVLKIDYHLKGLFRVAGIMVTLGFLDISVIIIVINK